MCDLGRKRERFALLHLYSCCRVCVCVCVWVCVCVPRGSMGLPLTFDCDISSLYSLVLVEH